MEYAAIVAPPTTRPSAARSPEVTGAAYHPVQSEMADVPAPEPRDATYALIAAACTPRIVIGAAFDEPMWSQGRTRS